VDVNGDAPVADDLLTVDQHGFGSLGKLFSSLPVAAS
jgi:hypothetical protein